MTPRACLKILLTDSAFRLVHNKGYLHSLDHKYLVKISSI